jgi:hypothetical protein
MALAAYTMRPNLKYVLLITMVLSLAAFPLAPQDQAGSNRQGFIVRATSAQLTREECTS